MERTRLNGGSYTRISRLIRQQVNCEYADFVIDCVNRRESFAIETTLRSQVTFEQAKLAKSAGFRVEYATGSRRVFDALGTCC
jgi:hypothetical protein